MKYLGVDYGKRKIGLAISEGQIASPLKVIETSGLLDSINKLTKIIEQEKIIRVIVGIPEGETGKMVKKFCRQLEKGLVEQQVEVIETDETLSSKDARKVMIELNLSKKERKNEDAYSAMLILQRFLNTLS
ncbi:MAG: hypothetical protein ACD_30C00100G0002 [uncultured bacterium]|uniref:Putative pre-16S rRNA nuclease n=4 Tax=Candidatus Daviesiibacteriota TaxID=1752718 RepID=A0A0G0F577_9BACT|nr:MAG: hypothetical protein ACD_30C00100G0002 [uncultured bacterium]KKQ08615.1 MAG: hypothetical protein US19_C0021G0031 [Candidatus Daviesbacteria bacterium GW2011_GWB1_36_5]KKQ16351.1 MAG: hypothetical protein US28_C0002G0018 [Candidatus Daviesbacteria bacterium GW2011_GWA1_36_8]OGE16366.1 MAG: hypothetical protein A2858_04150 [Candidatus Daviesbacteria bacterium RIFCSPHIGHO2_01_FULL_36_37]OGE33212.1 MAG: hypothetical protein A3C99_00065 [Candidatus Daviesbacteria bacterium RIFCSPHIGHO2_02_F